MVCTYIPLDVHEGVYIYIQGCDLFMEWLNEKGMYIYLSVKSYLLRLNVIAFFSLRYIYVYCKIFSMNFVYVHT